MSILRKEETRRRKRPISRGRRVVVSFVSLCDFCLARREGRVIEEEREKAERNKLMMR